MSAVNRAACAIAEAGGAADWRHAEDCARAAIVAIREPTDEMLRAALTTSSRFGTAAMRRIWQAMIDEALAEAGA